jgi:hypothetical protein
VDVCVASPAGRAALYGGPAYDAPGSQAFAGSHAARADVRMIFYRSDPPSALGLVPRVFERAALFRPDPVGAWTFWALLAAVGLGVPALLGLALVRATKLDP